MNWQQYRKGIAALVGFAAFFAARHGYDLGDQQAIVELVIAVLGVVGVYWLPNAPAQSSTSSAIPPSGVGILVLLVAVAALAGCGTVFTPAGEIPVSQSLSEPAKQAQSAINEANVALIAFNNLVGDQKAAGIITAAQRDSYIDQSDKWGAEVDKAQEALRTGDILTAQKQADIVKKLVLDLHRRIAQAQRTP